MSERNQTCLWSTESALRCVHLLLAGRSVQRAFFVRGPKSSGLAVVGRRCEEQAELFFFNKNDIKLRLRTSLQLDPGHRGDGKQGPCSAAWKQLLAHLGCRDGATPLVLLRYFHVGNRVGCVREQCRRRTLSIVRIWRTNFSRASPAHRRVRFVSRGAMAILKNPRTTMTTRQPHALSRTTQTVFSGSSSLHRVSFLLWSEFAHSCG